MSDYRIEVRIVDYGNSPCRDGNNTFGQYEARIVQKLLEEDIKRYKEIFDRKPQPLLEDEKNINDENEVLFKKALKIMTVRSANSLDSAFEPLTFEKLIQDCKKASDLLRLKNIGMKTYENIINSLNEVNLKFPNE